MSSLVGRKIKFLAEGSGELRGLFKSYNIDPCGVYEINDISGGKFLVEIPDCHRVVDVFPSRVELVD